MDGAVRSGRRAAREVLSGLVIGTGNTGAEIAVDLVEGGASSVRIAVRTPPNIVLRETNGIPAQSRGCSCVTLPRESAIPSAA